MQAELAAGPGLRSLAPPGTFTADRAAALLREVAAWAEAHAAAQAALANGGKFIWGTGRVKDEVGTEKGRWELLMSALADGPCLESIANPGADALRAARAAWKDLTAASATMRYVSAHRGWGRSRLDRRPHRDRLVACVEEVERCKLALRRLARREPPDEYEMLMACAAGAPA